jgi:hypothetical protein
MLIANQFQPRLKPNVHWKSIIGKIAASAKAFYLLWHIGQFMLLCPRSQGKYISIVTSIKKHKLGTILVCFIYLVN